MTMVSLAARLAEQANREFQGGYREALEFVEWLLAHREEHAWTDLEFLADLNWNVVAWIRASGDDPPILGFFESKNPAYFAVTAEPDMPVISGAHMEGFIDVLRSLWAFVREGHNPDAAAVDQPGGNWLDAVEASPGGSEASQ